MSHTIFYELLIVRPIAPPTPVGLGEALPTKGALARSLRSHVASSPTRHWLRQYLRCRSDFAPSLSGELILCVFKFKFKLSILLTNAFGTCLIIPHKFPMISVGVPRGSGGYPQ